MEAHACTATDPVHVYVDVELLSKIFEQIPLPLVRSISRYWNALCKGRVYGECLRVLRLWQSLYNTRPRHATPDDARRGICAEERQRQLVDDAWHQYFSDESSVWRYITFNPPINAKLMIKLAELPMSREKLRWLAEKRYFLEFFLSPRRRTTLMPYSESSDAQRLAAWAEAFGLQSGECTNKKAPLAWKPYCPYCISSRMEVWRGAKHCADCNAYHRRCRSQRKAGLLRKPQTFIRITKI
jgi:hypothetical protein